MFRSKRSADAGALSVTLCVALYFAFGVIWRRAHSGRGVPSPDIYAQLYPNALYARHSGG